MGQIRKRGAFYQIRYYRNGQRIEESTGKTRYDEARDLLRDREGDISKGVPITAKSTRLNHGASNCSVRGAQSPALSWIQSAEFAGAIRGETTVEVDGEAGLAVIAVIEAALESSTSGRSVEVASVMAGA